MCFWPVKLVSGIYGTVDGEELAVGVSMAATGILLPEILFAVLGASTGIMGSEGFLQEISLHASLKVDAA